MQHLAGRRIGHRVNSSRLASTDGTSIAAATLLPATAKPPSAASGMYGQGNEEREDATVRLVETQPEMDAHAAVHPDDDEQQALDDGARRPQAGQLIDIDVVHMEVDVGDARVDDVRPGSAAEGMDVPSGICARSQRGRRRVTQRGQLVKPRRSVGQGRSQQHSRSRPGSRNGQRRLCCTTCVVTMLKRPSASFVVEWVTAKVVNADEPEETSPQSLRSHAAQKDVHGGRGIP